MDPYPSPSAGLALPQLPWDSTPGLYKFWAPYAVVVAAVGLGVIIVCTNRVMGRLYHH